MKPFIAFSITKITQFAGRKIVHAADTGEDLHILEKQHSEIITAKIDIDMAEGWPLSGTFVGQQYFTLHFFDYEKPREKDFADTLQIEANKIIHLPDESIIFAHFEQMDKEAGFNASQIAYRLQLQLNTAPDSLFTHYLFPTPGSRHFVYVEPERKPVA